MRSTRVKMDKNLRLSAEMFDYPFFDRSFGGMALFQVPIARQGQVKVDMMTVA